MAEDRMTDGAFTELAGHGYMLAVVQVLVTEEYHLPFDQRPADFLERICRNRLLEVDALNLRTDVQG